MTHKRVEEIVASLRPVPDIQPTLRKLPSRPTRMDAASPAVPIVVERVEKPLDTPQPPSTAALPLRPARAAAIAPVAPERYKLQVTLGRETYEKLRRAQDLLRHSRPDGDLAGVIDRALTLLLDDLERRKIAAAALPRPSGGASAGSRHVPAAVKRAVWKRDGGRCAFKGERGRCSETGLLEFHHVRPFARGGKATVENIELRCRAHNQYEADLLFGPLIARERSSSFEPENSVRTELTGGSEP